MIKKNLFCWGKMDTRTIYVLVIGGVKRIEPDLYASLRRERSLKIFYRTNFETTIDVPEQKTPDIILVDLVRRDLSPLEIFKKVQALTPGIPVIYIGNSSQIDRQNKGKKNAGVVNALSKKGLSAELLARIIRYEIDIYRNRKNNAKQELLDKKLRNQTSLMRSILKETQDTIFVKDRNGKYIIVNEIGAANFNRTPDELIGRDNSILDLPEEAARKMDEADRQVIRTGESQSYEIQLKINGQERFYHSTKSPYRNHLGEIDGVIGITRDITDRKALETRLRSENAYLKPIEEALRAGVAAADLEGRLIYVNPAFIKMVGWEENELLGLRSPYPFWPPEELDYIGSVFQKKLEGAGPREIEYRFQRKNGDRFDVLVLSSPLTDGQGKKIGIVSTFTDITELNTAKMKLQESLNLLGSVMEGTTDSIYVRDLEGRYLMVNQATARLLGKSKEEITGNNLDGVFPPEIAQKFKEDDQRVLVSGKAETFEARIKAGGQERIYLTTKGPIRDSGGKVFGVFGVSRDITERKIAEEKQKHTLSLLNETIESTADGILVVDKDGRTVFLFNKRFLEMWHVPSAMVQGIQETGDDRPLLLHVAGQVRDSASFVKKVQELYNNPEVESFDSLELADGRIFERYSKPQMLEGNFYGRVWSFRDVTARKKVEEELLKVQKLESLGLLAGGIAHDFNNILTGIVGNISLALALVQPQNELFQILKDAESASERASGLAMQLLTFAKGGEPVKTSFSIKDLTEREVQFSLSGSNVQGSFDISQDLRPVRADRGQISQVIQNLVINAKQAMSEGGIVYIRARNLDLAEEPNRYNLKTGKYVSVAVSDTGSGIPKKIQSKIFDPYFSTKQKGSGLGLSIVYSIIKKHGGTIFLESSSGNGATFEFVLPAIEFSETGNGVVNPAPKIGKGNSLGLIIDDDATVLRTAGKLLERLGCRVETALSAAEGIEKFKAAFQSEKPFEFVITDLILPDDLGGRDILLRLKEIDPRVKVIVSSGYSNNPILSNYENEGFFGYVRKPYRVSEISEVLDNVRRG